MSKKDLKKKNIELNENDLENVSGGMITKTPKPNPDGTWSINGKSYKTLKDAYIKGNGLSTTDEAGDKIILQ